MTNQKTVHNGGRRICIGNGKEYLKIIMLCMIFMSWEGCES